jgi:hypothetical protein
MTATDTYHDIEPYAVQGSGRASARCRTHGTDTAEQWPDMSAAGRGFRCDEGRGWRFITETETDDGPAVPVMRDLSGLARVVRGDAEQRAYCGSDMCTSAWLWLGGGKLEQLAILLDSATGYDDSDYAYETWAVTGADGRLVTAVRVRIDGRS